MKTGPVVTGQGSTGQRARGLERTLPSWSSERIGAASTLGLDFWPPGNQTAPLVASRYAGPSKLAHPSPPPPPVPKLVSQDPGGEGPRAAWRGQRGARQAQGPAGASGWGSLWKPPPAPPFRSPTIRVRVYILTHAMSVGEREFFSLPLPPLIKNYKCLIKS